MNENEEIKKETAEPAETETEKVEAKVETKPKQAQDPELDEKFVQEQNLFGAFGGAANFVNELMNQPIFNRLLKDHQVYRSYKTQKYPAEVTTFFAQHDTPEMEANMKNLNYKNVVTFDKIKNFIDSGKVLIGGKK